jgi:hypothetical protein
MAHFAKLTENNEVLAVLTLDNVNTVNVNGVEDETIGQQYLEKHNNWPARLWIKTSYNTLNNVHTKGGTPFRGNYAGIGFTWDRANQIFWSKQPYNSWVKDLNTASWKSPIGDSPSLNNEQVSQIAAGTHGWAYVWQEELYQSDNTTGWILVDQLIK